LDNSLKEQLISAVISSKKLLLLTTVNSGVPFAEFMMLVHIDRLSAFEEDGGGVRVSRIKDQTHVSLPAVSQQLRTLENKGLIERTITAKDRRIALVSLTPAGCEVLRAVKQHTDILLDKILQHVGEDNIRQYIELSKMIMESLDPAEGVPFCGGFHEKCDPPSKSDK